MSCMIVSDRIRNRRYAPAVSSNRAPPASSSDPTALDVRSATCAMVISPAMVSRREGLRARSCNSSHSSKKNTSSLQSRIFFSRYSALPKTRQSRSRPPKPCSWDCSSLETPCTVRAMDEVSVRYASKAECKRVWNLSKMAIWMSIRKRSFWENEVRGRYRSV